MSLPWRDYRTALFERYGERVYRIAIDGGFTCPHRKNGGRGGCIYCDSLGSSSAYQRPAERSYAYKGELVGEIDSLVGDTPPLTLAGRLNTITAHVERGKKFIARRYGPCALSIYFQAFTNTYDSLENLKLLYDRALSDGPYKELIVSTRPDMVEDGVLRLLASYRSQVEEVCLELGLQSGNDKSLQFINRGHTVEEFLDACQRAKREGLQITTHLILGLPNEGEAEILESAKVVRESSSDALKIHHLQIGAGTPMALLYERGEVQAPTFEEHLENTILLLRHIPPTTVIQRLVSETPRHRLVAPRDFGDKAQFLATLKREMEQRGVRQGDAL